MKENKANISIGLTRQEFEMVITNSKNTELLKKYTDKLDNCDISRSAIELIREEDLATVDRITNEVLLNFPLGSKNKKNFLFLVGTIALIVLLTIIFLFKTQLNSVFFKNRTNQNSESFINLKLDKKKIKSALLEKEKKLSSLSLDSQKIDTALSDSILKTVERFPSLSEKKQESTNEQKRLQSNKRDYKRTIKSIKLVKKVPNKHNKRKFNLDDLVDFDGGNDNLKKVLLKKIKIKNQQVPKQNTSIIFKFRVSAEGKIKDINIQSQVDLELEAIIKKAILGLTSWKQGKKTIPVVYTIYVTYN